MYVDAYILKKSATCTQVHWSVMKYKIIVRPEASSAMHGLLTRFKETGCVYMIQT